MPNTIACTAKHPYAQFEWFGRKTTGTEWEPVEDVWGADATVETTDNVSTVTFNPDLSEAGQAFCRIGNPLYVPVGETLPMNSVSIPVKRVS